MDTTCGTLLDGRVAYTQLRTGYRTGIEPVLLAASIPAQAGDRVLEAGTGAGAGLLCLAARVAGIDGMGIERDAELAVLAQHNAASNSFGTLKMMQGDVLALPPGPAFDHAMANPPWHLADSTAADEPRRDAAKRGRPGLIAAWSVAMSRRLRHRGTLTLIVPARAMDEALAGLQQAGCGSLALMPLWPAPGREARIVLVQGIQGGRGAARVLPGLILHDGPQVFSCAAQAVLRQGVGLPF